MHYYLQLVRLKLENAKSKKDTIYSAGMLPYLIIELVVCSILCPPKVDSAFKGTMLTGSYVYR